jgi:hypothetical protein
MYSHHRHKHAPGLDKLWVVAVISNPARYRSRYELFKKFKHMVERAGANLLVVELALGDRPFEVTDPSNPHHVQLRTWDEIWHKENMINLGIQRLPDDWEYVAWIDADIEFMRQDWAEEIVHQLQHYQVIQLFQNAVDLGPQGEVLKTYDGFMWSWVTHQPMPYSKHSYTNGYYPHWHPGYAWAARREAVDYLGGLIDWAILGAADHHMACALIGKVTDYAAPKKISAPYKKHLIMWQDRALKHIRKDVGYMPGTIFHHWHGKKADRKYIQRWDILLRHNYDPEYDLKRDWQGVLTFTDQGERMRNDIREYFRQRNEDSIDL